MGQRWTLSRESKLEALRLVRDRGVSVARAACDLDLHENVLRNCMRQQAAGPKSAFPGHGQMTPEQIIGDRTGMRQIVFCPDSRELLGGRIMVEGTSELIHIGLSS